MAEWWEGMGADQIVEWSREVSARQAYEFAESNNLTREGFRNQLGIAKINAAQSGANAKLASQTALKTAKMQIDWGRERMMELEIPQMQVDAWYKASQVELARAAQEINRGELGLSWTQTLAQVGQRPEDYFQAADIARGAQARQDVPIFMRALLENVSPMAQGGPGGGGQPTTAASLAEQLMGTGAAGGDVRAAQDRRALEVADQIFKRGGGSVLPGLMESLTQTERSLLASAGGKKGYDVPAFMETWARSRPGQGSALAAA